MLLLQQMIVLFIYMMIGYVACKKGKLDDVASSKFSWIVLNVANPMLIISSAVNNAGGIEGKELLLVAGIAVGMFAIFILLAQVVPKVFHVKEEDVPFYKLMMVFNNLAFMGFPVISATYGNEALMYATIFPMVFNTVFYTYGVNMVEKENTGRFEWKRIMNIGVLSCVLALGLFFAKIPVPQFIKTASQGLGNLTGPLSMIVIGISFTKFQIRELFTDVKLLIFALFKLVAIPVIGTLCLKHFISNEVLCGVCMIIMSTPVASMTVMLAQEKCENCETIAKGISLTTLLSVVTIPLVSMIVSYF